MSEKLQKILANRGFGSRREIEKWIEEGRITIKNRVVLLGERFEESDLKDIKINEKSITLRQDQKSICRVLIYYKPEGELCTRNDPENRATVFSRLPRLVNSRWINIGRLDINTSGLLLFTTDGELAYRLMHPKYEIEREYSVRIFGKVENNDLLKLKKGVLLEDGMASFNSIKFVGGEGINQWYNVTLSEGKNREVRRIWESIGVRVSRLVRIRYGKIILPKGLPRGGWIEMDLKSVNQLRKLAELPLENETKVLNQTRIRAGKIRRSINKSKNQ